MAEGEEDVEEEEDDLKLGSGARSTETEMGSDDARIRTSATRNTVVLASLNWDSNCRLTDCPAKSSRGKIRRTQP